MNYKKRLQVIFLAVMVLGCVSHSVQAQDTVQNPFYKGVLDSIQSKILKQTRYIEVFIPQEFTAGSTETYDVLYVLDGGNWNTGLVSRIQQFIQGEGHMPPTIIVSVMGIDRNKELTPTPLENWKGSGEGDAFLSFIKSELIPHVNKTYPSNGDNTLWGHSLSGMFTIYALLKEPDSFTSFIAVDPSLWWDVSLVPKLAAETLPELTGTQ